MPKRSPAPLQQRDLERQRVRGRQRRRHHPARRGLPLRVHPALQERVPGGRLGDGEALLERPHQLLLLLGGGRAGRRQGEGRGTQCEQRTLEVRHESASTHGCQHQ
jgi:hypothetical protein